MSYWELPVCGATVSFNFSGVSLQGPFCCSLHTQLGGKHEAAKDLGPLWLSGLSRHCALPERKICLHLLREPLRKRKTCTKIGFWSSVTELTHWHKGRGKSWQLCHSACRGLWGTLAHWFQKPIAVSACHSPWDQEIKGIPYALFFRLHAQELLKYLYWYFCCHKVLSSQYLTMLKQDAKNLSFLITA